MSYTTKNAYSNQIENRNFLSPTGFKFSINRAPKVSFFCNTANIPSLTLGVANQPNFLRDIPIPGEKIEFGDLTINFLVDEYLENYMELQTWIRGLGFPESIDQYSKLNEFNYDNTDLEGSSATLEILTSKQNSHAKVNFTGLFPYDLSTLDFDATNSDVQYFTAQASFKYTMYNITDIAGNKL
jgi:hypothetical protein